MRLYSCVEETEIFNGNLIIKTCVHENDPLFVTEFTYKKDGTLTSIKSLYNSGVIFYYSTSLIQDHINGIYIYEY